MPSHLPTAIVNLALGVFVIGLGALVARHPDASYRFRTGWKHDGEVTLSEKGRTDVRVTGGVVVLVGLILVVRGVSFL